MEKKAGRQKKAGRRKWSGAVTKHSNALDLEKGIFAGNDPEKIAHH